MKCSLFLLCIICLYSYSAEYHLVFMLNQKEAGRRLISKTEATGFLATVASLSRGYVSAAYFPCERGYLHLEISAFPRKLGKQEEDDVTGTDFVGEKWAEIIDKTNTIAPVTLEAVIDLFCKSKQVSCFDKKEKL